MPAIDLTTDPRYLKLLPYAAPGSGKTSFCASATLDDRTTPVLHLDAAGNPDVYLRREHGAPVYDLARVRMVRVDTLKELSAVYEWLHAKQPLNAPIAKQLGITEPFKTVVYDGATELQRQYFDKVMGVDSSVPIGELLKKAEWGHYRTILAQMLRFASLMYQRLEMHVIVTALRHEETRFDPPTSKSADDMYKFAEPLLYGQSVEEVPGYAKAVFQMYRKAISPAAKIEGRRCNATFNIANFEHSQYQYGKDQHGFGAELIGDPTITKLLDAMA